MAEIISIATAVPNFKHPQKSILHFMQESFGLDPIEKRKLAFLYAQSGISFRHSVIADFGCEKSDWKFIPNNSSHPFPTIDQRMELYKQNALPLALKAIEDCVEKYINTSQITHLITISCTGMSAPGLDLEIVEALNLSPNLFRSSINFMGCYAAIHGLKLAQMICATEPTAQVMLVAVELCTLHFQKEYTADSASSSLLFGDGCAAVLVNNYPTKQSISIEGFHSHIALQGKQDMAWQINTKGFLMHLSSYIPKLIEADIATILSAAKKKCVQDGTEIKYWCIHPGGKKIVDLIQQKLLLTDADTAYSRKILEQYGNMSAPTILFVLKEIMEAPLQNGDPIFGVAFGPGLTMETFVARKRTI